MKVSSNCRWAVKKVLLFFAVPGLISIFLFFGGAVYALDKENKYLPVQTELKNNWPAFRGEDGSGFAPAAVMPAPWDYKTGTGILWKTIIPLEGASSPVVWGNNVFITGANPEESRVFCYDAKTGALRWSAVVSLPGTRPLSANIDGDTTLAAPTPATDGRFVFAVFPTGEVAAFDFSGKQIWAKNIGSLKNSFGFAASLTLYKNSLILQLDLGSPEEEKSKMLALDKLTGKEIWKTPRPNGDGWASPVITVYNKQLQIITCGNPFVLGYNPEDGRELWRIKALEGNIASSPIVADNKIIAIATSIVALDPAAKEPAWQFEDGVPDVTSPVSDGEYIYILGTGGELNCVEAKTGKKIWMQELEGVFNSSPVIVGKTLLLMSEKGVAYLASTGAEYKELGRGEIDDECVASPAPAGGCLYIRGKSNLYCIGKK